MDKTNLFENIPKELPEELIEVLAASENIRIERIVSKGQCSEENFWYDQDQNEFVLVVKGKAKLEFLDPNNTDQNKSNPNKKVTLQEGDSILIKAHQRHRVSWTTPDSETIWLAVFFS